MFSVEDKKYKVDDPILQWQNSLPSALSHHGDTCCQLAKQWILSLDRSFLVDKNAKRAPYWIRMQYEWGPNSWPLYWCEMVKKKAIDCGALAAVSREIFQSRGLNALPVQLIEEFASQDALQWQKKWTNEGYLANWILEPYVYHEACALVDADRRIMVWDPTDNAWNDPHQTQGYGSTQAIRVSAYGSAVVEPFIWGEYKIPPNMWFKLQEPLKI
jgi:hypothetical protein